mmetsp:Transcript_13395/g.31442  ORF Transcript_13395/g.31442 Transcript_13395/m.31442 type:complete len:198 (+) Transcript_13395:62-655(+)
MDAWWKKAVEYETGAGGKHRWRGGPKHMTQEMRDRHRGTLACDALCEEGAVPSGKGVRAAARRASEGDVRNLVAAKEGLARSAFHPPPAAEVSQFWSRWPRGSTYGCPSMYDQSLGGGPDDLAYRQLLLKEERCLHQRRGAISTPPHLESSGVRGTMLPARGLPARRPRRCASNTTRGGGRIVGQGRQPSTWRCPGD